ncbi:uncharacterized protein LOC127807008 isoform X2 [Diospyros lotus]|uniref:uncharacterized protein LOC127807008 isoform X2 n=1 Tax=Diospyros lotus TaxID=55363 RepID=UPI00225BF318|nr:uncharacterized protein LOC127807008 isoform X2 [Diospyros lotus]
MSEPETLVEAALRVLNTPDPVEKARLGDEVATKWLQNRITQPYDPDRDFMVPDRPARLATVELVPPGLMPKLGKAGSLQSRQAILHSLVHTESWAIDLSWVAQDEGRHFSLLAAQLEELGSFYGALPAHDGLWDSATATSQDLLARLAIEHCVHEARGLDVLPTTILRFRNGGDNETADLLEKVVYPEEITHCAAGVKWFKYLCFRSGSISGGNRWSSQEVVGAGENNDDVINKFHQTVRAYFKGPLKPPFNEAARRAAGFGPRWYEPLATKGAKP